jgi:hypothetical protein
MTTDSDDLGADALANRNAALEAELRVLRAEALRAQGDATGYQVACEWRDKCRAAEAERDRLAAENAALRARFVKAAESIAAMAARQDERCGHENYTDATVTAFQHAAAMLRLAAQLLAPGKG